MNNEQGKIHVGIVVGLCALAMIAWAFLAPALGMPRATYSLIMRWVNFGIIALVIFKFGRKPIMNFLAGQQDQVAASVRELEEAKQSTEEKIAESQKQLEAGQAQLEIIKERIVSEGQRRKAELIANAQQESAIMMESAKLKIEAQMRDARNHIRNDLIDMAADLATNKLPALLTAEDHDKLLLNWMKAAK